MQYTNPLGGKGSLLMDFTARQIQAKSQGAYTRSNVTQATLGTVSGGQVSVPGIPGLAYINKQTPGCRSTNLIANDYAGTSGGYNPGNQLPIQPGQPGTRPRLQPLSPPPQRQNPPTSKPPLTPGNPGSGPYYPPPNPGSGTGQGNKVVLNCPIFDSGYGGVLITGADLRSAINSCGSAPCNAVAVRAELRISYQSFAGTSVTNPFDTSAQAGQGDADNYCYVVDAKGNPNYAQLNPVDSRFALFITRCFEGNSVITVDMKPTTTPIKLFGKANAWPLDTAHTGRIQVTLVGVTFEYPIKQTYYKAPLTFDFSQNNLDWSGAGWTSGPPPGIGFFSASCPYPIYIPGGNYQVVTEGHQGIFGGGSVAPGFTCFFGGTPGVVDLGTGSTSGPDGDGNFTVTQNLSFGDGFYGIIIGGTLGFCKKIQIL